MFKYFNRKVRSIPAALSILSLLLTSNVHSQVNGIEKPQIFPPTPQTQVFEKYLNHQLTEYNGLPSIAIPLYTIEIKGMKIPITLSYHAGGVKYKSYDGEIGAGWSINAGGYRVSRTIYGKPDEMYPLYNASTAFGSPSLQHSGYLASIAFPWADSKAQEIMAINNNDMTMRDGEVDQFNYMLPSTSGQFLVSDRSARSVALANANQDKILLDPGSPNFTLSNIKIFDNAGFEFQAGGMQGSVELAESSRSNPYFKTSWPVSKIVSPYNEVVDFTYFKHGVSMNTESYYTYKIIDALSYKAYIGGNPSAITNRELPDNEEQTRNFEDMFFIQKIQTEKEKVEFIRQPNSNVLSQILVTNLLNNETTHILFYYYDSEGHRLLTGVSVNGKMYGLDYYDPPAEMSDAFPDQWGYYKYPYTGNEYWGLFLHEEFKNHYFAESEVSGNTPSWVQIKDRLNYIYPAFIDRESNSNPHYFSLKTITFPTGGTTTYEYEPNQYSKATVWNPTGPTIQGAGQRVKKIISHSGPGHPSITTLFKYGPGENGNGKVDVDYLDNIKYNFFSDTWSYDITSYDFDWSLWYYSEQRVHTYSPKPLSGDIDLQPPVEYEVVTTYQLDESGNQTTGKTVSTYDVPSKFGLSTMYHPSGYPANNYLFNDLSARYVSYYGLGVSPTLKKKEIYKQGSTLPLRKEEYTYETIGTPLFAGIKVKQRLFLNRYPVALTGDKYLNLVESFTDGYFDYGPVNTNCTGYRPLTHVITEYDGATPLVRTTSYSYNTRGQVSQKSTSTSLNTLLTEEYSYPETSAGTIYGQMENKNIISPVIKTIFKNNGIEQQRIYTNFTNNSTVTTGLILPETVQRSFTGLANLSTELSYQKYDSKGNVTQFTTADGIVTAVIWGYAQKFPIATVAGTAVSNIFHTSFEDAEGNSTSGDARTGLKSRIGGYSKSLTGLANGNYELSYWQKSGSTWTFQTSNVVVSAATYTISLTGQVDEIRFLPKTAQMTTATYNPHKGMSSQTNVNNRISTYEYDELGRLSLVRDHDRNIIKKICYNYNGEPENCGAPVYGNAVKTGQFTRNNCGTNGTGTTVTYTVAAGTYTASTAAAADALAQADVNANGQAYANSQGSCSWANQSQSVNYQRNNCGTNGTGTWVTYTVNGGTVTSTVSLADANQQAVNTANANAQAHANYFGSCSWVNQQQSSVITRNDCGTNGTGSSITYYVYNGTFSSTTSLADANQQALNNIATYGQAYANANAGCTWINQAQSGTFTKECPANYAGSSVTYTIAQGTYSSTTSLAHANTLASNAVNSGGQAYANANGTCTFVCNTSNCTGQGKKCVNNTCETGVKVYTFCEQVTHSQRRHYYHYEFSDGSWSQTYTEMNSNPCEEL